MKKISKKILKNKKGFTLMELIIVMAILAILAAILIPTFANVIDDANISAAKSEARNNYTENMITELNDSIETGTGFDSTGVTAGKGESGDKTYWYNGTDFTTTDPVLPNP